MKLYIFLVGSCVVQICFAQTPRELTHYDELLAHIEGKRQVLALRYQDEPNDDGVIDQAGQLLTQIVSNNLAPLWYGTDWAFNGTSERPRTGSIACGYFVTTLLRDAGLRIPRYRMAQVTSEKMIRSLVTAKSIKRFSNTPIHRFIEIVKQWGDGLYVVGLDIHTGFIICDEGKVWFVHSSYQSPYKVVREPADRAAILASSKYRVLGKMNDKTLLRSWLKDEKIPLQSNSR